MQDCAATINYGSISLWVAIASFLASVAAALIAKSALSQAKQVAERDQRDWRQRKWFDLYFKANGFWDSLDRFQTQYSDTSFGTAEFQKDWNDPMLLVREVHSMAVVFPQNPVINELFLCTAVFKDHEEALSKDRLKKVLDALEGIRQRALVDTTVLG